MKISTLSCLIVLFTTVNFVSNAQTNTAKSEHPVMNSQLDGLSDQAKLKDLVSIHAGTYQFRVSIESYYPLARLDILETVANQRLDNEDQLLIIDEHTKLYIPSYAVINDPSFTPLEQMIYAPGDLEETLSE